jgi:hypothetical protein
LRRSRAQSSMSPRRRPTIAIVCEPCGKRGRAERLMEHGNAKLTNLLTTGARRSTTGLLRASAKIDVQIAELVEPRPRGCGRDLRPTRPKPATPKRRKAQGPDDGGGGENNRRGRKDFRVGRVASDRRGPRATGFRTPWPRFGEIGGSGGGRWSGQPQARQLADWMVAPAWMVSQITTSLCCGLFGDWLTVYRATA